MQSRRCCCLNDPQGTVRFGAILFTAKNEKDCRRNEVHVCLFEATSVALLRGL
jgi:hypothetical protein